ncbi:hypothetical protein QZM76_28260 [Burkholderia multivorans]|nr:hypothetical protein [Burkholderia multivorans]
MSLPTPAAPPARAEEKDLFDRGASDWIVSPGGVNNQVQHP